MYSVVLIYYSAFDTASVKDACWNDMDCRVKMTAAGTKEEIVEIINLHPDMVFICTNENNIDIFKITDELTEKLPGAAIGFISGIREFEFIRHAVNSGISGFVSIPFKRMEFKAAVDAMKRRLGENEKNIAAGRSMINKAGENDGLEEVNSFVVRNAVAYIEENYKNKISLSDVAEEIFVSRWHLSKVLNQYLGKSFSEIINGYRIEAAKKLLLNPSMRIGEIAEEVGFSDSAHFSHVFKKMVGMSANEYRNRN